MRRGRHLGLRLRNNVSVADWKGGFFGQSPPDEDYNLFYHLGGSGWDLQCDFTPCSLGAHSLDADPAFVDPADGDLRPRCESPVVDAGTTLANLLGTPDRATWTAPASQVWVHTHALCAEPTSSGRP